MPSAADGAPLEEGHYAYLPVALSLVRAERPEEQDRALAHTKVPQVRLPGRVGKTRLRRACRAAKGASTLWENPTVPTYWRGVSVVACGACRQASGPTPGRWL